MFSPKNIISAEEQDSLERSTHKLKNTITTQASQMAEQIQDVQTSGSPAPFSYKDKLVRDLFMNFSTSISHSMRDIDLDPEIINTYNSPTFIPIDSEEKKRLYQPWVHALIIKLFGRKIGYKYLLSKLSAIWKSNEAIVLMDLGNDFYLILFTLEASYKKALYDGSWFIGQHFLSIRKWEPKFDSPTADCKVSAI